MINAMKHLTVRLMTLSIVLLIITVSCGRQEVPTEDVETSVNDTGVTFTRAQIEQAGIKFGNFEEAELSHDVFAKGKLVLPNNRHAQVSTTIGGIVSHIWGHPGDYVKKGQNLCRLSHPDIIKAQQDYLNAKFDLDLAKEQYERLKVLVNEDVASRKNFQVAERDYFTAETNFNALKMNAHLAGFDVQSLESGAIQGHLDIVCPITGKINNINLYIGQYVSPGMPLFDVVDKSELHVELMVFEKDIPFIETGQRVTLTLSNISDHVFEADIFTIGSTMEETARTIPVLAHLHEVPDNSYPGMFVSATIHTGESIFNALPEDAIVAEHEGEYYIYYTLDDYPSAEKINFLKVRVEPGLIEDGSASMELLEPLPENAHIVVSGGYYIRSMFIRSVE